MSVSKSEGDGVDRRRDELEQVVREHGPALLRTAVLLTGSRAEADDLLQDALEVCFRRWPSRVEFPGAYLRTTLVRLPKRRRFFIHRSLDVTDEPAEHEDPYVTSDRRSDLLAALRELPAKQRAAVVLRHWEGYSEAEAARVLDCSTGTIKSQTSRGLRRLREVMRLREVTTPDPGQEPRTPPPSCDAFEHDPSPSWNGAS